MHDEDNDTLNAKAILLAVGGATLAALLFVLARRDKEKHEEPAARAEAFVADVKQESKKAAKAAKKKRHEWEKKAAHFAEEARHAAPAVSFDANAAERDLKAAAWDAQQAAREAEGRLRAAGHRVADDASHLASRVGAEARNLAGGGRERLAHLRHRGEPENATEREIARLHAEVEELRGRLGMAGKKEQKDFFGLTSRLGGRGGLTTEAMTSQATAAALAQLERSLKAKAPQLLAAKNRAEVVEILQKELGPTLRETGLQALAAAFGLAETAKQQGSQRVDETRERAYDAAAEAHEAARVAAEDARAAAEQAAEAVRANGKHRFWHGHDHKTEVIEPAREEAEKVIAAAGDEEEAKHRGHAGLIWGGAGLGLALYALLDAERRDQVLRLANEASVQFQELVRDLQGYDDEF